MDRRYIVAVLICLGVVFPVVAQPKPGSAQLPGIGQVPDAKKTTGRVSDYLNKLEAVGFTGSVLVEINGGKVISHGYGLRNAAEKQKNTPGTVFDIGSITKQFTAAGILKLEMQGKLTTSDKITKYFPGAPADKSGITIHQLLRHIAGLPSVVGGDYDKISEDEFIGKVMQAPLKFQPGARFSYSNVGYSLLAIIIERVSGQKYEQFLYDNLWHPAGMEMTGYSRPVFDKEMIATGYKEDVEWGKPTGKEWGGDAPFWHLKGNGGVLSTTEDMYKWHRALLTDSILSKEAKEKYYHPQFRPGENENSYYAYGWAIRKTPRNTILAWHSGTNRVFCSDFYRYIDEGVAILFLSNKAHPDFRETDRIISKIIFDPDYTPVIPVADNKANREFTDEVIRIAQEKGPAAGLEAAKKRQKGVDVIERRINDKGYDLLGGGKKNEAITIFELGVMAFPQSANAFDSLGEAYMEVGNKKRAIENYEKSLKLDADNKNAEEMLKKLRQ
jgi:CubicO group peptidase (beta-lactamase class C family)